MTPAPSPRPMDPAAAPTALVPPPDEQLADLAELVLSVAREVNLHDGTDAGLVHLTATEIHVMRYVGRHPGTRSKEVAEGVGLQRSNFSVALRSLKDRGMVAVVPDGQDGRSSRLYPTDLATCNFAHHRARWAAFLATVLGDRRDVPTCLDLLNRIDDALDAMRRAPER